MWTPLYHLDGGAIGTWVDHPPIRSGVRTGPDYPGIRSEDVLLGKLDRPNLLPSAKLDQRVFHFVSEDSHPPVSDTLGKFNEEFFDYGSKLSVSLLVPGALMSAWNVKSAFEQGGIESAVRVGVGEAAGWAGAWLGGELGAAVGTAVFPGVGTMIGGLTGAMLGGIFGQQGVDYLYQLVAGASWNNYWTDRPMAKRGPN